MTLLPSSLHSHVIEGSLRERSRRDARSPGVTRYIPKNSNNVANVNNLQMLRLEDFYIDQLILRKIHRLEKQNAQAAEDDDDDEEDSRPRGTQRNRPTQIDDDEDDDSDAEQEQRRRTFTKVKREREKSRGVSVARAASLHDEEDVDAMDTD